MHAARTKQKRQVVVLVLVLGPGARQGLRQESVEVMVVRGAGRQGGAEERGSGSDTVFGSWGGGGREAQKKEDAAAIQFFVLGVDAAEKLKRERGCGRGAGARGGEGLRREQGLATVLIVVVWRRAGAGGWRCTGLSVGACDSDCRSLGGGARPAPAASGTAYTVIYLIKKVPEFIYNASFLSC